MFILLVFVLRLDFAKVGYKLKLDILCKLYYEINRIFLSLYNFDNGN